MSLHDNQAILLEVLSRYEPGGTGTTYSESLPLSQGMVHQALVTTDHASVRRTHIAGLDRQITLQEFPKRAFTNETNAGTVFLGEIR